jgi:hypothetical protein
MYSLQNSKDILCRNRKKYKKSYGRWFWKVKAIISKNSNDRSQHWLLITETKTIWHGQINRHAHRIEDPEINLQATALWFSTKVWKTFIGEKAASLTNGDGKTGYSHVEEWN